MHDDLHESWVQMLSPQLVMAIRHYLWPANVSADRGIERAEYVDGVMTEERERRDLGLGRLLPGGDSEYEHHLPRALAALLQQEISDQPDDVTVLRGVALGELLGEERRLMLDREKLVGHMVLRHEAALATVQGTHAAVLKRHALAHRTPAARTPGR